MGAVKDILSFVMLAVYYEVVIYRLFMKHMQLGPGNYDENGFRYRDSYRLGRTKIQMPVDDSSNGTTGLNGIQVRNLARNFKEQIIDKLTKPNSKVTEEDLLKVWKGHIDLNYSRTNAETNEHFKTFASFYRFMG